MNQRAASNAYGELNKLELKADERELRPHELELIKLKGQLIQTRALVSIAEELNLLRGLLGHAR